VTDDLLRFGLTGDGDWDGPTPVGGVAGSGLAVLNRTGVPDVFARSETGGLSHWGMVHVEGAADDRPGWEDLGGDVASTPIVLAWSSQRMDILANDSNGAAQHWGWAGQQRYYDAQKVWHTGRWYGPEASVPGRLGPEGAAVSMGNNLADIFGRAPDGTLQTWSWDGTQGWDPYATWAGPTVVAGGLLTNPAAIVRNGCAEVYAFDKDTGDLIQLVRTGTAWTRNLIPIRLRNRPTPLAPPAQVKVAPDYVVMRPDDLAIVGVSWTGYDLVDGDPPALQANGQPATLTLALPPQHVGEEVLTAEWPTAPIPAPFPRWRAMLAGPSRLVVTPTAPRIELTAAGLLAAAQGASVVSDGAADTELEVPWQLVVTPNDARAEHSSVVADDDTIALWRSVLQPLDGKSLTLSVRDGGGSDPFALPLDRAGRNALEAQTTPAELYRLEVSALGATLSAKGTWDTVEWEHDAVLGRDQRVRLQLRGVLYPFGHHAVLTQITERFGPDSEEGDQPVAVLHKRTVLTVTEPVRDLTANPIPAFPFDTVELTTLQLTDLDDPGDPADPATSGPQWTYYPRVPLPVDSVNSQLEQLQNDLANQPSMPGDWAGGPPVMEHMINAVDDLGGDGTDDEIRTATTQAGIAQAYLNDVAAIEDMQDAIAALAILRQQDVPWYLFPMRGGARVPFSARLRTATTTVDVSLPLMFVVDWQLPQTETMPAFDSLQTDPQKLIDTWGTDAAHPGAVTTDGSTLDLVRSGDATATGDHQVVRSLNLYAQPDGRGVRPRLGPPPGSVTDWAMEVALPAARTLLPDSVDAHVTKLIYSPEFEAAGSAVDVAFHVFGGDASPVNLDFSKAADRSGGLVSPSIAADAISRVNGLVNAAGLASLNPADLFKDAKLLGFPLETLVDGLLPKTQGGPGAPAITTDLKTSPPTVSMVWEKVALKKDVSPFGAIPGSADVPMLTLSVVSSGVHTKTECTVENFALTFPSASPLLTLTFVSLHFLQQDGQAPTLEVKGIDAKFQGALDVLQALQDKVGLADTDAHIDVGASGVTASYALAVPDASAGAFVMRNLSFHAGVVVPFQGDPVRVSMGFASREKPFNLSVMMLGGGGYADVELDYKGLQRLEISLEFGAAVAVDFVIAKGEAHILGGIRFELQPDQSVTLTGYLRIGGSLEVLGLVSVSVELMLTLGYETTGNRLVGRATLVIEIDVTLFSDSVELDSGEWTIAGDDPPPSPASEPLAAPMDLQALTSPLLAADSVDPYLAAWAEHRRAYEAAQ
jgi:hypothetical protein